MRQLPAAALMLVVRLYRWTLSPAKTFLFGPMGGCRFEPSCSAYALEALRTHGALAGTGLALKRICRCHPWGACGHDPVPPRETGCSPGDRAAIPQQHGKETKPGALFPSLSSVKPLLFHPHGQ